MGGIENADYETMIDCARWAVTNGYLPTRRVPAFAASEILRFVEGDPGYEAEAQRFREIFDQWEEETR